MSQLKKCLEIVRIKKEKVVKRFDLTGKSTDEIENIYKKETEKLDTKTHFGRIIDVPADFEAKKIKSHLNSPKGRTFPSFGGIKGGKKVKKA